MRRRNRRQRQRRSCLACFPTLTDQSTQSAGGFAPHLIAGQLDARPKLKASFATAPWEPRAGACGRVVLSREGKDGRFVVQWAVQLGGAASPGGGLVQGPCAALSNPDEGERLEMGDGGLGGGFGTANGVQIQRADQPRAHRVLRIVAGYSTGGIPGIDLTVLDLATPEFLTRATGP